MACDEVGKTDRRVNQFNKIKLLNDIANQIINYAINNGHKMLMDKVDMSCGAIPDGDFDQVIDLNSPHQFLSLYMQIAENRFAMACTELLKMSKDFLPILQEFCGRVGRDLKAEKPASALEALEIIEYYVLDGMPCDDTKQLVTQTPDLVSWEKVMDTHEAAWTKAGGELAVYYDLQKCYVNGLLDGSGYKFNTEDGCTFTILKA